MTAAMSKRVELPCNRDALLGVASSPRAPRRRVAPCSQRPAAVHGRHGDPRWRIGNLCGQYLRRTSAVAFSRHPHGPEQLAHGRVALLAGARTVKPDVLRGERSTAQRATQSSDIVHGCLHQCLPLADANGVSGRGSDPVRPRGGYQPDASIPRCLARNFQVSQDGHVPFNASGKLRTSPCAAQTRGSFLCRPCFTSCRTMYVKASRMIVSR